MVSLFVLLFLLQVRFQCGGQLVGTAGWTTIAGGAFQLADDFLNGHVLHQAADALQVATASTYKLYFF